MASSPDGEADDELLHAVHNVTMDPAGPARAAERLTIEDVFSRRSGKVFEARKFIEAHRYDRAVQLRLRIREALKAGTPLYACPICDKSVRLVSRRNKAMHFRHVVEDDSCPAATRGLSRDEVRARKYQGARESEAHKKLKELIRRSLAADPEFSDVKVEKTWRASEGAASAWRKPDVQGVRRGIRFAFEGQLTTTFLDVVVDRKLFYREERAALVWIMPRFRPGYRRQTEDDVFLNNNSNVLLVDERTTERSEAEGRFMVRCFHREPYLVDGARAERWREVVVPFSGLHVDLDRQWIYHFDFEAAEAGVQAALRRRREELDAEVRRREQEELQRVAAEALEAERRLRESELGKLRDHVLVFMEENAGDHSPDEEIAAWWAELRMRCRGNQIALPTSHMDAEFRIPVCAILSAMNGRPIGFGWKKLVEVGHYLAEHHRDVLYAFGSALKHHDTEAVVLQQDVSGKWARRRPVIKAAISSGDPEYVRPLTWEGTLEFLFPELRGRFRRHRAQQ